MVSTRNDLLKNARQARKDRDVSDWPTTTTRIVWSPSGRFAGVWNEKLPFLSVVTRRSGLIDVPTFARARVQVKACRCAGR